MTETDARTVALKQFLGARRRELQHDLQSGMREGRTNRAAAAGDTVDMSDADVQGELGFALVQITAETMARIDDALARLDAGTYGSCASCGSEIDERRLRALPFAVRCRSCEERREAEQRQVQAAHRRTAALFLDSAASQS